MAHAERVARLAGRLRQWVALRRTPPSERRLAVLLYGFPPGVGATGTAALLNVPKSLEGLLARLQQVGAPCLQHQVVGWAMFSLS